VRGSADDERQKGKQGHDENSPLTKGMAGERLAWTLGMSLLKALRKGQSGHGSVGDRRAVLSRRKARKTGWL
jgi:hypothetical protein